MKGNVLRFIGLMVLLLLTLALVALMGAAIVALLSFLSGWISAPLGIGTAIILGLPLAVLTIFLIWAVPTKAMSLVYQELSAS